MELDSELEPVALSPFARTILSWSALQGVVRLGVFVLLPLHPLQRE